MHFMHSIRYVSLAQTLENVSSFLTEAGYTIWESFISLGLCSCCINLTFTLVKWQFLGLSVFTVLISRLEEIRWNKGSLTDTERNSDLSKKIKKCKMTTGHKYISFPSQTRPMRSFAITNSSGAFFRHLKLRWARFLSHQKLAQAKLTKSTYTLPYIPNAATENCDSRCHKLAFTTRS
jgi:hypothetical protein